LFLSRHVFYSVIVTRLQCWSIKTHWLVIGLMKWVV